MNEPEIHAWLVRAVFLMAGLTFLVLLLVPAPYGRHSRPGWGPTLPYRLSWILMESPAVFGFLAVFLIGKQRTSAVPLMLAGLWLLHYVYRTLIYPFRVRASKKTTPWTIVLMGFTFNVINAYINARWISGLAPDGKRMLTDPWLWAGVLIFLSGWLLNRRSDRALIRLREPGTEGYRIPRGGAFEWITCPNYLGEIVEWLGFALAARSGAALAFAVFTAANLVPRAIAHHRWYRDRFQEYPPGRRALIPYLL